MPSRTAASPRLTRRVSLAPSQVHNILGDGNDVDGASLLIDLSLSDLQKTSSPEKDNRGHLSDDALDALSEQELERLAWEAMEEEKNLKAKRRRSPRLSSGEERIAMENSTIRRRSNSPRKAVEAVAQPDLLAPLPRTFSSSTIKHSYDRQASPSRSAMKKSHPRKSVVFGSIDEYEISVEAADISEIASLEAQITIPLARSRSDQCLVPCSSSSGIPEKSSVSGSSSPLSRFNKTTVAVPKPKITLKTAIVKVASPKASPRAKISSTISKLSTATTASVSKKISSRASPKATLVGSRMREAIKETSAKSRFKARQSAVGQKAKISPKETNNAPNGFRISSTGALVAETKCKPFKAGTAKVAPRRGRSSTSGKSTESAQISKVNPVPVWMKRRRDALARAEDDRLQAELERVRNQELKSGINGEKPAPTLRREKITTSGAAPTSAVEKRIAERAVWEAKRKEKEDLINAAKDRAKKEREAREDEEYRLARQRTVVRANPVPDFIRSRRAR